MLSAAVVAHTCVVEGFVSVEIGPDLIHGAPLKIGPHTGSPNRYSIQYLSTDISENIGTDTCHSGCFVIGAPFPERSFNLFFLSSTWSIFIRDQLKRWRLVDQLSYPGRRVCPAAVLGARAGEGGGCLS